jgi:APA family basic amino acid/polyamine antiporter
MGILDGAEAWTGQVMTLVIALAVLGSLNATVLAGARISFAMARDRVALGSLETRSARFGTPAIALWVQAALAALLVLSGRFEQLIAYVVVMLVITLLGLPVIALIRRARRARTHSPCP